MKFSNELSARAEPGSTSAHVTSKIEVIEYMYTSRRLRTKFATHDTVSGLWRSRRPREKTLCQHRLIQLTHLRNRFANNDTWRLNSTVTYLIW